MVFDSELRPKKAFPVLAEAVRANDESGTIGEVTSVGDGYFAACHTNSF
jgi:hypothetical protein